MGIQFVFSSSIGGCAARHMVGSRGLHVLTLRTCSEERPAKLTESMGGSRGLMWLPKPPNDNRPDTDGHFRAGGRTVGSACEPERTGVAGGEALVGVVEEIKGQVSRPVIGYVAVFGLAWSAAALSVANASSKKAAFCLASSLSDCTSEIVSGFETGKVEGFVRAEDSGLEAEMFSDDVAMSRLQIRQGLIPARAKITCRLHPALERARSSTLNVHTAASTRDPGVRHSGRVRPCARAAVSGIEVITCRRYGSPHLITARGAPTPAPW